MGKKLRNKVIAVAVAATMTIPDAVSAGAEIIQDLSEIQQDVSEQTTEEISDTETDIQEELDGASLFSDDYSEYEDEIVLFNTAADMAKDAAPAVPTGVSGTLFLSVSQSAVDSAKYDFTISGIKVLTNEIDGYTVDASDFKVLDSASAEADDWEIKKATIESFDGTGYIITLKGTLPKNTKQWGKYKVQYTYQSGSSWSCDFECQPFLFNIPNIEYKKSSACYFDYFDDRSVYDTIELVVPAVNADKLASYDIKLISKAEYSDDSVIDNNTFGLRTLKIEKIEDTATPAPPADTETPADASTPADAGDTTDSKKYLKDKVKIVLEVNNEFNAGTYYLAYNKEVIKTEDGKKPLTVTYKKNICALGEMLDSEASTEDAPVYKKGTRIENGVLSYDGDAVQLNIKSVYNKQTITGVQITGPNVESVILPYTVKKINSGAFSSAVSLKNVVLPDTVKKIADDAFIASVEKIYYNGNDKIFDKIFTAEQKSSKVVSYGASYEEGENIEVTSDIKAETNLLLGGLPDDIEWLVETTDGKSTKVASIKYDGEDEKKVSVTNTKAAGQFNNQVIVKAVSSKEPDRVYFIREYYITPSKTTTIESKVIDAITVPVGGTYKLDAKAKDGVNKNLIYETDSNCFTVVDGIVTGVTAGTGKVTVKSETSPSVTKEYTINVVETAKLTTNVSSLALVYNEPREFVVNTGVSGFSDVKFVFDDNVYEIKNLADNSSVAKDKFVGIRLTQKFTVNLKEGKTAGKSDKIEIFAAEGNSKAAISLSSATVDQNVVKLNESIKKLTDGVAVVNIPVGTSYNVGVSVLPVTADQSLGYEMSKSIKTDKYGYIYLDDTAAAAVTADEASLDNGIFTAKKVGTYYVIATSAGVDINDEHLKSNIYQINAYESGGSIEWKDEDYVVQGGILMEKTDAETTCTKMITGGQVISIDAPGTAGHYEQITWVSSNPGGLSVVTKTTDDKRDIMELGLVCAGTYTVTGTSKYSGQKYTFKVTIAETDNTRDEIVDDDDDSAAKSAAQVYRITETDDKDNGWISNDNPVNPDPAPASPYAFNTVTDQSPVVLPVGTVTSVRLNTSVCGSKLTYKSSNPKAVSCDARGNIKVLAEGEATVTVTMTKKIGNEVFDLPYSTITIRAVDRSEPIVPVINIQLQESIQDDSSVSTKRTVDDDGNVIKELDNGTVTVVSGDKLNAYDGVTYSYYENKLQSDYSIETVTSNGESTDVVKVDKDGNAIKSEVTSGTDITTDGLGNDELLKRLTVQADYSISPDTALTLFKKRITVYQVLATKVTVHPEDAEKVKRLSSAGSGLKAGYTDKTTGQYVPPQSVVIDFLAEGTVAVMENRKVVNKSVRATADDIEWTSSNRFLATIKTVDHKLGTGNDTMEDHFKGCKADIKKAYEKSALITANDKNYKGVVTFTGTFRNSGKKVTFKILIE